jgi:hypothetical protein
LQETIVPSPQSSILYGLTLQSMHGADAEPYFPCHFANSDALSQLAPSQLDFLRLGATAAKPPAHLAFLAGEFAVAGDLRSL